MTEPTGARSETLEARLRAAIDGLPRYRVKSSVADHEHGYVTEERELVELRQVQQALSEALASRAAAPQERCNCSVHMHCPRCCGIQVEPMGAGGFWCLECGYKRAAGEGTQP